MNDPGLVLLFVIAVRILKELLTAQRLLNMQKHFPMLNLLMEAMYACSQDAQDKMVEFIKEKNLNRIVVAACTPKTHEPLFQETLTNAGLNKYLFEMTNIRNHNSWVHKNNPEIATQKAKDLLRMAVAKAALAEPLKEEQITVNDTVMVVGGGLAGMTSAKSLAAQGYQVHIVEKKINWVVKFISFSELLKAKMSVPN